MSLALSCPSTNMPAMIGHPAEMRVARTLSVALREQASPHHHHHGVDEDRPQETAASKVTLSSAQIVWRGYLGALPAQRIAQTSQRKRR